jgi:glycerol-3-phosphate dehydrogenase (NAD(P)+)
VHVTVIGGGAWGTTVASLLSAQTPTTLWALEDEVVEAVRDRHENPLYLPGLALHPSLRATTDLAAALDGTEAVFMAVPSQHYRQVLERARDRIAPDVPFLSLTKGIEAPSLRRMSQVAADVLADHYPGRIGVLSGPNIAREVASGHPSATVVAMVDEGAAQRLQALLMTPRLRVYTNPDVAGCEIGGSVKNVIALAAGMAAGLGFGQNTLAALVTRGLAELTRLGVAQGGQALTFLGLAGIGDLVVTCHSPDSRNRHVGEALGRGRALEEILGEMRSVAEGVRSCEPILELAKAAGVELPICEQVGRVLRGEQGPPEVAEALLGRDAKPEMHGIA